MAAAELNLHQELNFPNQLWKLSELLKHTSALAAPSVHKLLLQIFAGVDEDSEYAKKICEFFEISDEISTQEIIAKAIQFHNSLNCEDFFSTSITLFRGEKEEFSPDYIAICKALGKAGPMKDVDEINDIVSKMTNQMIPRAIDEVSGELLNIAVGFFKSQWMIPFECGLTHKEPFTNLDGSQVIVDMMVHPKENILYFECDEFVCIGLKFGTPENDKTGASKVVNFIAYYVLPKDPKTFHMTQEKFELMLNGKKKRGPYYESYEIWPISLDEINLSLPRHKMEFGDDLIRALTQSEIPVGDAVITKAYTDGRVLDVCKFNQKMVVEANEVGVKAAAVASCEAVNRGGPTYVKFNEPFQCHIMQIVGNQQIPIFQFKCHHLEGSPDAPPNRPADAAAARGNDWW